MRPATALVLGAIGFAAWMVEPAWGVEPAGGLSPEAVRRTGVLAMFGIMIAGVGLLMFVLWMGWRTRRQLRQSRGRSRMTPQQWQARRWRESWRRATTTDPRRPDDEAS